MEQVVRKISALAAIPKKSGWPHAGVSSGKDAMLHSFCSG